MHFAPVDGQAHPLRPIVGRTCGRIMAHQIEDVEIEEEEYDYGAFLTFKSIKSSGKKRRARTPVQHTQNRRIV